MDNQLYKSLIHRLLVTAIVFVTINVTNGYCQEIPDSLYKNANAIILNESITIKHDKYDKYVMKHKRKIKILNKKAEQFQSVYIHYKKGSEKINDLKITVYNAEGKLIKKVKSSEIEDNASSDGYSIISDYRIKRWSYNTQTYPIVIEYSYQKDSKNTLSLPVWYPIPHYNVSVLTSTYEVNTILPVRTMQNQFENYNIDIHGDLKYTMNNQNAIKSETYSPPFSSIVPSLYILPIKFSFEDIDGTFETWNEYGQWIQNSFLTDKKLNDIVSIKSEINKHIKPEDNKETISRKIYKYLQEHTRYVSVSLDEGGLNPMDPNKVHSVGYGDCKALSFYMKSLLEIYDIKSNYVEVAAESSYCYNLYKDFPSPFPGNHIILNIPIENDTFWIDCTSNNNPFNYLGSFTDNRIVLEINTDGGNLVQTPKYKLEDNRSNDTIVINIINQEKIITEISRKSFGLQIEKDIRNTNLSIEKIEKYLRETVHKKLPIENVKDISINVNNANHSSNFNYTIECKDFLEAASDYTFIPTNILSMEIPKLPKDSKRDHEIHFPRSSITTHTYIVNLPENADIIESETMENTSEYGTYKYEVIQKKPKQIIIKKTFTLNEGHYDPKEYKQIKSFFDKCYKSELNPLTIKKI